MDAARRLRAALAKKWLDGPKVTIDGGIVFGPDGWFPLNPDILPMLNGAEAGA